MLFRRFLDHNGAGVLPMFGLLAIPAVGLIGASVDYSRASAARAVLQSAVDSTALAMSRVAPTLSAAQLSNQACTYFIGQIKASHYFVQPPDTCTNGAASSQGSGTSPSANAGLAAVPTVNVSYSSTVGTQVTMSASSSVPTLFMRIPFFGIQSIPISANTTAKWGETRLRVALVLDNTGSMSQGSPMSKLSALQTAVTSTSSSSPGLLTQLQNIATNPGDVYVSIIPFVKDTNIGSSSNYTQVWMDFTDWEAEPANLDTSLGGSKPTSPNWNKVGPGSNCPFSTSSDGFVCANAPASSTTIGTIASSGNYKGLICPGLDNGSKNPMHNGSYYNGCYDSTTVCTGASCTCPTGASCTSTGSGSSQTTTINTAGYYFHTWRPATNSYATPAHSTWNGCVTDRGFPVSVAPVIPPGTTAGNDETVTAPVVSLTQTLYPAEQYSMCPSAAAMGLNYDWSSMTTLINSMTANGNTNQAIGLQLGWMSLAGGSPFTAPTEDPNYTYRHYIIILTDGLNTQDRWYGTSTNCGQGSTALAESPLMCMDQREAQLCDNFKAQNTDPNNPKYTIYAIQVNTDGEATSKLLEYCAGSKAQQGDLNAFWILTSPTQIHQTFNSIVTDMAKLHLAK